MFAAGCACMLLLAAGVNGIFNNITANGWVNSVTGFQFNGGAGTSGQTLCSDGTYFDTPCNPGGTGTLVSVNGGGSLGTANLNGTAPAATSGNQNVAFQISGSNVSAQIPIGFYNTVELANTAQTQRLALNFTSGLFTATDSSSPSRTDIALNAPGTGTRVATYGSAPGSTTAPAIFDGNANLVPASAYVPRTCVGAGCYKVEEDGTIWEWVNTPVPNNAVASVTLPFTIPTAIMSIVCSDNGTRVQSGNDQAVGANVAGQSAPFSSFSINSPATSMNAYCTITGY